MSDSDPTPDELEGLTWWRNLSDTARIYWLEVAKGTVANPTPADAWAASKRVADRAEEAPAAEYAPLRGQPVEDLGTDETEPGGDDEALAATQSTVRRDEGGRRLARKAALAMSAANQLPFLMKAAAFQDWDTPDGSDRWELVDGIPRAMAPASVRHGLIHGETGRLIGNHLAEQHPECRVSIGAGLRPNDYNVRIPDITVSCGPLVDDRLLAEPIVVVEILSPSNASDTWRNVALYTTISSVRGILVLHTADVSADLLRRKEDGTWPDNPLALTMGDSVTLESIDFTAPIDAFYRTA